MNTRISGSADSAKPATGASTPGVVNLGPASELTRGGLYNDEDSDGVRKTK